jgi:hypothetical protein
VSSRPLPGGCCRRTPRFRWAVFEPPQRPLDSALPDQARSPHPCLDERGAGPCRKVLSPALAIRSELVRGQRGHRYRLPAIWVDRPGGPGRSWAGWTLRSFRSGLPGSRGPFLGKPGRAAGTRGRMDRPAPWASPAGRWGPALTRLRRHRLLGERGEGAVPLTRFAPVAGIPAGRAGGVQAVAVGRGRRAGPEAGTAGASRRPSPPPGQVAPRRPLPGSPPGWTALPRCYATCCQPKACDAIPLGPRPDPPPPRPVPRREQAENRAPLRFSAMPLAAFRAMLLCGHPLRG